ncbi:hypothetical protein V6N12_074530 [Hibiscus sabdariffa]|uniref:RNase H type-1 domain-containing protein n=1 Tax=Hibiscus sabdariffa TaxID=183260 RepID=A0ABR2AM00_9ROSI
MKFNDRRVAKDKGAGCGGVLQTEYGVIRALLSGPVEDLGEDIATLVAIKSALEIFVMSNWIGKASLWFETNSRMVLSWFQDVLPRPWRVVEEFCGY